MIPFIHSLNVLLPLVYGFALLTYASYFRTKAPSSGRLAHRALLFGMVLHGLYLVARGIAFRHFPITNFMESFTLLGFGIASIYYVIERTTRDGNTGVFFVTIVFAMQLISSMFLEDIDMIHPLLSNPLFGFHTTLTIYGMAALAVSFLYGGMYLVLAKEMKRHRFGVIYDRLPPLDKLESMATTAITVGLVVLGGGILLGHAWAGRTLGTFIPIDPKVLITDAAWILYAGSLFFVRRRGWTGLRMGHFAVWTFVAFFSSILLVNFFASSFHRFQT